MASDGPGRAEVADPDRTARSWLRRTAASLALVLAGVVCALALGEGLVRVFWEVARPATERSPKPRSVLSAAESAGLPTLDTLRELSRKNARGIHKGLPFRTNAAGFRGPDYAPRPAPDTFRILVAGDSVTMGTGVLEQETYAARLERQLNEAAAGVHYEVLNVGLSGLNTRQVVDRIAVLGLDFHPHLIVYGFTLNDIEGPAYVSSAAPGAAMARVARYLEARDSPSYLWRAVWPRLLALHEIVFQPEGSLEHDLRYNFLENQAAWGEVTAGLARLAALAHERGVCAHVLVHTGIAQLNRLYPFLDVMERVEQAARDAGLSASQSFPYFEGRDPSQLRLSYFDGHPNADGHAILATALRAGLADLPEHCWSAGPGGRPAALRP